jgi:outer membrane receptor protein involved in Fe transport
MNIQQKGMIMMNGNFGHWRLLSTAALAAACLPSGAIAAQAPEQALDEIVVTAQKRSQALQDVPLSISAITAEQIEKRGFDEFTDYARSVPGLSFVDRGAGRNKITLRGVSTGVDQNNQSPVGIYIDETPVSYPNNEPDLRLYDVERIEVLRGPQGTLYGAGSMGGTIRILTAKPRLDAFEGSARGLVSTTRHGGESIALNAMANIPLATGKAAVRAVGYYRNEAGFVDNVRLGQKDVNDNETWGARVSLKVAPTETFDATATVLLQRTRLGGSQEIDPALAGLAQRRAIPELRGDDLDVYGLVLHHDLGWADLTSSTSYLDRVIDDNRDVTAFLGVPVAVWLNNIVPDKTFVQEVRLASRASDAIEWIVGLYYSHRKNSLNQLARHDGLFGLPRTTPLLDSDIDNFTRQYAAFGEVGVNVTEALKVTAGLRAFHVKQRFSKVSDGIIAGGFSSDSGSSSESKINPKVNISYRASPDFLVYAQAAQGFRVGGPNTTIPALNGVSAPATFNSDSLWNYEVGIKSDFLDGKATLNASLFYIDWSDIQVTVTRPDGFSYVANGNTAVSKGLEAELAFRPVSGLELAVTLAYTDAYLASDSRSGAGRKGDPIPAVPHWSYDIFGRYGWTLSGDARGFVQANLQHVGRSYNGFRSDVPGPDLQHSYRLANAKIGIETDDFDISLYVNNIFDKQAELYIDTTLNDQRININRPRTFGLMVGKRF